MSEIKKHRQGDCNAEDLVRTGFYFPYPDQDITTFQGDVNTLFYRNKKCPICDKIWTGPELRKAYT